MSNENEMRPPDLLKDENGEITASSLADLIEWFLNYDQRVAAMRHPSVQELFEWKQADDAANGKQIYPFENAEARFAVGTFQTVAENNSEHALRQRITDVLQTLGEAKQNNEEIAATYNLQSEIGESAVMMSQKLPSKLERRFYLTSCWFEALCTAEVRVLGWIYQEVYGKPFEPIVG